jgi:glycosyltransferase involved in cell wall biosynthesis
MKIFVMMPALNEAAAIGRVIAAIDDRIVQKIIVADNGSTDATAAVAQAAGAIVVHTAQRGYGYACLAAMAYAEQLPTIEQPDIVVFLDADFSDFPNEIPLLIAPILAQNMDMVIGSRVLGAAEKGALMPVQRFGNWLSTHLIHLIYKVRFTDLGPFRAIRWQTLLALRMHDKTFGWTVEMQVKAAKMGLRTCEVPVSYRQRIGISKVSGTVKGSILAGYKILWTIFRLIPVRLKNNKVIF